MKRILFLLIAIITALPLWAQSNNLRDGFNSLYKSDVGGWPNLQIRCGASLWQGYNLSLKADLGGSKVNVAVEAGIGIKGDYYSRHFKCFLYGISSNNRDSYGFGVTYGQYVHEIADSQHNDELFYLDFEYSHFFEKIPRLGYFLGGGVGAEHQNDSFVFELYAGLSWKILME